MTLSVVIPTLDEAAVIGPTIDVAQAGGADEVIVADADSRDGTADEARRHDALVVETPVGRGRQMNAGAAAASGDVLLFLHADTRLPDGYRAEVRCTLDGDGVVAGAFHLGIDGPQRSLRLVERAVSWRSRRLGLPYGDQTLFMRREIFDAVGGYPDIDAMEDFVMARRLRRLGRIAIADAAVATSARRWLDRGVVRTTLLNQACVVAFVAGVSPVRIARWRRKTAEPPPEADALPFTSPGRVRSGAAVSRRCSR